ncbi:hypothetical protein, partial [Eubacterium sp. 1001713B170207_170306_E7]|uniref:hypothetical protein n=1 Tax=Eubacterium sp. 1001713B170207_170306_E7 TaxID=2787097 RepID=UPI001A9B3CE3
GMLPHAFKRAPCTPLILFRKIKVYVQLSQANFFIIPRCFLPVKRFLKFIFKFLWRQAEKPAVLCSPRQLN